MTLTVLLLLSASGNMVWRLVRPLLLGERPALCSQETWRKGFVEVLSTTAVLGTVIALS